MTKAELTTLPKDLPEPVLNTVLGLNFSIFNGTYHTKLWLIYSFFLRQGLAAAADFDPAKQPKCNTRTG